MPINKIAFLLCITLTLCAVSVPVLAVDSYQFATENTEEFYKSAIPNSDFGVEVIDVEQTSWYGLGSEKPRNAPGNSGNSDANYNPSVQQTYPSTPQTDYTATVSPYNLTPVEAVRKADGSIGILKIPAIGLTVTAYDGEVTAAMKKGVGHIESTSSWLGNIGLCGHNRGVNENFGKLKNLKVGDEISYTTSLGTRTYIVTFAGKIASNDWNYLQYTTDNRITLLTCVEGQDQYRLCVHGVEKR